LPKPGSFPPKAALRRLAIIVLVPQGTDPKTLVKKENLRGAPAVRASSAN